VAPLIVAVILTSALSAEASFVANALFGRSETIAERPALTLAFATALSGTGLGPLQLPPHALRGAITAWILNLHPARPALFRQRTLTPG
jgi:hypothetical protein